MKRLVSLRLWKRRNTVRIEAVGFTLLGGVIHRCLKLGLIRSVGFRRSPFIKENSGLLSHCLMFSSVPAARLSKTETLIPRVMRASSRWLPMKPTPRALGNSPSTPYRTIVLSVNESKASGILLRPSSKQSYHLPSHSEECISARKQFVN